MSAESDARRYRAEANRLRNDISKASGTVAAKRKKASDATSAASRSKNAMTVKTKVSEGERATKEANDAEKRRADLEKKLAGVEVKATRAQETLDKERQTAQARGMEELRRKTGQAASQFGRSNWLTDSSRFDLRVRVEPARDVFLSHASEDKDEIARPLRDALVSREVSVWFDEIQIKVGNSIRQSIERGIAACRFGVVVLP